MALAYYALDVLPELLTGRGAALLEAVQTAAAAPPDQNTSPVLFAALALALAALLSIACALHPLPPLPRQDANPQARLLDAATRLFVDTRLLFRYSTHLAGEITGCATAAPALFVVLTLLVTRTAGQNPALLRILTVLGGTLALVLSLPIALLTAAKPSPPADNTFRNPDLADHTHSPVWTPIAVFAHALWTFSGPALARFRRAPSHTGTVLLRAAAVLALLLLAPADTILRLTREPYNRPAFAVHAALVVLLGSAAWSAHVLHECLATPTFSWDKRPLLRSIRHRRSILAFAVVLALAYDAHASTTKLHVIVVLFGLLAPIAARLL